MSTIPKPPSLLRRPAVWRLLLVALFAEVGYAVLNMSTMQLYLRDDRHFDAKVLGWVLVSFLLSEAIFKGPMGHLADRWGPRRLMSLGPAMSVLTCLLSFAVPHTGGLSIEVLAFMLLRALDGLGAAMLWPAAFAAIGGTVEDDERQQAMSLMNLCYMLGIALAFPIGGIVNDLAGNKWASLILAAGLLLAAGMTSWKFAPDGGAAPIDDAHSASAKDLVATLRQIPAYMTLAIVTFMGIGFPMATFKLFAVDQFKFSETQFGALICPGAIAMAAASVPLSRYGERIGRAGAVHLGIGLCSVGMWMIGAGAFVPVLRTPLVLALAGIPVGIGFLLAIPAWMASVSDIDRKRRGVNLGAVMTAQGVGAIIGTPIGTACYGGLTSIGIDFARYSPFLGCAVCVTSGWLISLRLLRPDRG